MYSYYRGSTQAHSDKQPPARKRSRRSLTLVTLLLVAGMAVWGAKAALSGPAAPKSHNSALLAAATSAKQSAPIDRDALGVQINQAINDNSSLEIGVSIIDLTDNSHYDYGLNDTEYIAASTTKLLSASLFLHDVEHGKDSLGQSLGDSTAQTEMERMIVVSDDDAWEDFNALLGHPALLAYAHSLGMNSYDPTNNTITPDDLASLLARLYQGKLLNTQHTDLLLGYMAKADYTQYIGGVIPKGVKFYHKIGFLQDRVMDAAIIDNGVHPYVLVIFTKDPSGNYDQTAGLQAFHDITNATLAAFAH